MDRRRVKGERMQGKRAMGRGNKDRRQGNRGRRQGRVQEQCCGSGSGFNQFSGSGSRGAKMTQTKIEKIFFSGEGFSYSLDVLYGGVGRSKLLFLIKKYNFFHM